jgi:hypothetical protein
VADIQEQLLNKTYGELEGVKVKEPTNRINTRYYKSITEDNKNWRLERKPRNAITKRNYGTRRDAIDSCSVRIALQIRINLIHC